MKKIILCFLIVLTTLSAQDKIIKYSSDQEYLFKIFETRRSIRNFKDQPIPKEHLEKILHIATTAPTSGNQQPWKFLVIQDRSKLNLLIKKAVARSIKRAKDRGISEEEQLIRIGEKAKKRFAKFLSAPVYVSVLVDSASTYPSYNRYDGSLAAGYLLIAARSLGYGTVFSQDSIPFELIKEVFEIPDQFEQICFTPIGIPVEWPKRPKKKNLEKFMVNGKFIEGENYIKKIVRTEIKMSAEELNKYVGKYEAGQYKINVSTDNHKLIFTFEGSGRMEFLPYAEDKFFIKSRNVEIDFVKEDNKIKKFIWHQDGEQSEGVKVKE